MNFYQSDMWWLNSAGPQKRRRRRSGVTFSWFWTQSPSNGQRGCRKCWSSLRRKRTHQMIKRTRPFIARASMLFVSSIVCLPDIFQQRGIPKQIMKERITMKQSARRWGAVGDKNCFFTDCEMGVSVCVSVCVGGETQM